MKNILFCLALALASTAQAGLITFSTPVGSTTDGHPVNATAAFTTSTGQVLITLTNLQADPTSVIQNLSDLAFNLSNTSLLAGTLSSSAVNTLRTIDSDGNYVDGSAGSDTGWAFSSTGGGGFLLNVLGTLAGPAHLIVGPPNGGSGDYDNANGSIAGNGPHNPFINQFATFTLSIPGVTEATTITAATFSFGTTEGTDVPGGPSTPIPEPASLLLIGGGLVLLGSIRRLRMHS